MFSLPTEFYFNKEYKDNKYIKYFIFRYSRLKKSLSIVIDNSTFWTLPATSAIGPVSVASFSIMEK